MEIFRNFYFAQDIVRQLIQPRPCNYLALDIWKHITNQELYDYESASFLIPHQRTVNIHLVQNKNCKNLSNRQSSTCIVYLHGLASFCVEGIFLVQNLEEYFADMNVSVCLFDLRGHGKDKAANVTFGLEQSKQLYQLLLYLNKERNYKQFVLWGRSMGATTILNMVTNLSIELSQDSIQIKYMVLDSAFSSIEKVANEIISKKSGMPQIFCRPIFQYIVSTVQKLHNIKLVLDINNLPKSQTIGMFLYSETDNLINSNHSKILYQKYAGPKEKIQMNVGHNQERPLRVLKQIFEKIRISLLVQPKNELRSSISLKKTGLNVTKNNKIKTQGENTDQIKDSTFSKAYNNQYNKENYEICESRLFQQKITPSLKIVRAPNSHTLMNTLNILPKPYKITKQPLNIQNVTKKLLLSNGNTNHSKNMLNNKTKEDNLIKNIGRKKQQKLKLSHKNLIEQIKAINIIDQQRHQAQIYETDQLKKCSVWPSKRPQVQKVKVDFNDFNEIRSEILKRNQIGELDHMEQNLKRSYIKKKYQQQESIQKKFFLNHSVNLTAKNCCGWTIDKINFAITNPQSQNTRTMLKNNYIDHLNGLITPKKLLKDLIDSAKQKNTTNLRKAIDAQLLKQSNIIKQNHNYLLNSDEFFEKTNKKIYFNLKTSIQKKSEFIHRLSNQSYL